MVIYQIGIVLLPCGGMFRDTYSFNPFGSKNINTKVVENVRINSNGDFENYIAGY